MAQPSSSRFFPPTYYPTIQSADGIPALCTHLAHHLFLQPVFTVDGTLLDCQVVLLQKADDVKIISLFNKNILEFGEKSWVICGFGRDHLYPESSKSPLLHGLVLLSSKGPRTGLGNLHATYMKVLETMRKGWVNAEPKNHSEIMFKEDPDQFHLFLKDESLQEEVSMILFMAKRFSIKDHVECDKSWITPGGYSSGKIYLWLRKSALAEVTEKIGFIWENTQKSESPKAENFISIGHKDSKTSFKSGDS